MADKDTGGTWESIGRRWSRDSEPPAVTVRTHDYEKDDAHDGVLYGPKGNVISRVVDREPKMGFRKQ
jgi:hypothetical protein